METKHPLVSFHVSQEDINEGCRASGYTCAVARAISKKIKNGFYLFSDRLSLDNGPRFNGLKIPPKVESFISSFDKGQTTKPFSFRMRIPKQYLK